MGIRLSTPLMGTKHGPAKGPWQTAQRGEVLAVAHALNNAPCRIHIYTDSRYVANALQKIIGGTIPLWQAP